jgi:hypothetical protein
MITKQTITANVDLVALAYAKSADATVTFISVSYDERTQSFAIAERECKRGAYSGIPQRVSGSYTLALAPWAAADARPFWNEFDSMENR